MMQYFYTNSLRTINSDEILLRILLSFPYNLPRKLITRFFYPPPCRTNLIVHVPISCICCTHNGFNVAIPDLSIFCDSLEKYRANIMKCILGTSLE